ncbi:unnamed protein product [Urochloa decumbens]|uniref:RRM domain-containing protein n=1 Tax=Urochloa decumbens TaxID=240449 RepID=A0ABC9B4Y8_9POAL
MPDPAQPDDAAWRPWADLQLDLLRDISRRLHTASDYARFHAACMPWRHALPPPPLRPAFLPWLLSPPDSDTTNHRRARCVFSSTSSRGRAAAATEIWVPDRRWVVSPEDGTATSALSGNNNLAGGDLLLTGSAGAAPLPSFPLDDETKWWAGHAVGKVSGDGTVSMFLIGPVYRSYYLPRFNATFMRPGDAAWTVVRKDLSIDSSSSIVYYDGKIVVCNLSWHSWCIAMMQIGDLTGYNHRSWSIPVPSHREHVNKYVRSSYLVESGGELLWAFVLANDARRCHTLCCFHTDLDTDDRSLDSFVNGLLVSVYALQDVEGGKPQWVKREGHSLVDRIMFPGKPSSFSVDAARFGDSSGGCAYFVVKSQLYGGIWSKSALERCRVFRYNFYDGKSELVEQLPAEWSDEACMWLTPQPSIASTEEIRDLLEPSQKKPAEPQFGPLFRIYVGNLSRKVDSCQLRQFFSKHSKVTDVRVMCHIKTKRSRGFGFVTMATTIGDDPAHVIAKLDGQILDGRPLRVKFADQGGLPGNA